MNTQSSTSEESPCPYQMNELLEFMIEEGASDLHLQVGQPPTFRINGLMTPLEGPDLRPSDTDDLMRAVSTNPHQERLKTKGGSDFGFSFMDKGRFRVSLYKSRGATGMVLRTISNDLLSLGQLGLPDKIIELLTRPRGLLLVTGPTGSGKSTTLASMINWINENRDGHIITIEDPIEYYHNHKRCLVTQREVGTDVPNFAEALRGALRQDPDVIMLGEMRDLETIEAAISAAETGHLVLATLHTTGAARTVDRILDAFPADAKEQVRTQLASSILAVVSQVLCRKLDGSRVAGFEIMVANSSIRSLIRENKTFRITSDIQTGAKFGMITLDSHLMSLVTRGFISPEEALIKSQSPGDMRLRMQEAGIPLDGK